MHTVDDHANALLLALEKGKNGRSYNIGNENERTNLEVVKKRSAVFLIEIQYADAPSL